MFNIWEKRIIITQHAFDRFRSRNIKKQSNKNSIVFQVKKDLNALNIRKQERLGGDKLKVTTKQGKVYILVQSKYDEDVVVVKTVWRVDLREELIPNFKGKDYVA